MALGTFSPGPFRTWTAIDFPQDALVLPVTLFITPPNPTNETTDWTFTAEVAGTEFFEFVSNPASFFQRYLVGQDSGAYIDFTQIPIDDETSGTWKRDDCNGITSTGDYPYESNGDMFTTGDIPGQAHRLHVSAPGGFAIISYEARGFSSLDSEEIPCQSLHDGPAAPAFIDGENAVLRSTPP